MAPPSPINEENVEDVIEPVSTSFNSIPPAYKLSGSTVVEVPVNDHEVTDISVLSM